VEKFDLDVLDQLVRKYPVNHVIRTLADTIDNLAENHEDVVRRRLLQVSNHLRKEGNRFRFL